MGGRLVRRHRVCEDAVYFTCGQINHCIQCCGTVRLSVADQQRGIFNGIAGAKVIGTDSTRENALQLSEPFESLGFVIERDS